MPTSPEVLHESTGLKIRRNPKNRFTIVTLHYTADPAKRSAAWKEEASSGMQPAQWAKEMEIDYTALFGQRVFPEIIANRDVIVVKAPHPEVPGTQTCYGGFDFGQRNPSAFNVYTINDGVIYAVWELYEPCRSVPELVGKMKDCPYWDRIRYIAADPTMWSLTKTNKWGQTCTVVDLFIEAGIGKWLRGNQDEALWVAQIRKHWISAEDPTFRIYDSCPNLIREFETAVYSTPSEKRFQTSNYREGIADYNNHAIDGNKYFFNSPAGRVRSTAEKYRKIVLPTMSNKWKVNWGKN